MEEEIVPKFQAGDLAGGVDAGGTSLLEQLQWYVVTFFRNRRRARGRSLSSDAFA